MTTSYTELDAGDNKLTATTQASNSYTPPANHLILAAWYQTALTAPPVPSTVPTGNGLTWVQVGTSTDSAKTRVTVYRAMGASPTTGALTFNGLSTSDIGRGWTILDCGGVDTTGTNGSGALVQQVDNNGAGTTLSCTMGTFGSSNNGTVGFGVILANVSLLGGVLTATATADHNNAPIGARGGFATTNAATPAFTSGTSAQWSFIGIEIKAGAAATNASAGVATGTGSANSPAISLAPTSGAAAGTGAANAPGPSVKASAGVATGTGSAFNAAPSTGTNAAAGVATGTGTANQPAAPTLSAHPGNASGTGAANSPKPSVGASGGNAAGVGAAYPPTLPTLVVHAGVATGTGATNAPTITVLIQAHAGVASGIGTAWNPNVAVSLASAIVSHAIFYARLYDVGAGMPIEIELRDAFTLERIAILEGARNPKWTDPLNDLGSGTFLLPIADPKAQLINPRGGQLISCRLHGQRRFSFWNDAPTRTIAAVEGQAGEFLEISGRGAEAIMGRAGVYPTMATPFLGSAAGALAAGLDAGIARGTLALMSYDFTAAVDSAGASWNDTNSYDLKPPTSVLDLWRQAITLGVDYRMTPDLKLQAYQAGLGSHLESVVVFRQGHHIRSALTTAAGSQPAASRCIVTGADGTTVEVIGDETNGRYEIFVEFTAGSDPGTLIAVGQNALAQSQAAAAALNLPLSHGMTPGQFEAYLDYNKGDWIAIDIPGQFSRSSQRIVALTIEGVDGGDYLPTVDLNFVLADELVSLQQRFLSSSAPVGVFTGFR